MARIAVLLTLALLLSCRHAPDTTTADAHVLAIADAYVADVLDERPGSVARLRPPGTVT